MTHSLRAALLLCPLLLPDLVWAQAAKFTEDSITLRQDPALPTDAARKGYVDSVVSTAAAAAAAAQAAANAAVQQSALGQPNGPARLGPAGTLPVAQLPVGTGAGAVAAGNDLRIVGAAQASSLALVATSGNWGDLAGKPALAPVATTGAYSDLAGRPTIPVVPPIGTAAGTVAAGNDPRITGAAQATSLAAVATSGSYNDLAGKPVIPSVPSFGTSAGTVAAGNDPRIPVVGNQTPGTGSMVIDLLNENGSYPLKNEAGIWGSANVRAYMGVSRTFNPGEGAVSGPVAALFGYANNNGTTADVVAVLGDSVARVSGTGSVFGGNLIARTAAGVNAKLVGLEVDVEPAAGTTASAGSIGVAINSYSTAIPGPAVLIGSLGGGTFANGVQCAGIAATGSCLAPQSGSTMKTMMDSTVATLNDAAVRIGPVSAGAGQRIVLQGSDALDAVITTDTNKFLKIATGTNGLAITNQPQSTNLLLLSGATGDVTLPVATAKLTGTGDLTLNATTGQVNLLTGMKLATRTVTSGASDTALAADTTIKWVKAAGSASAENIPACVSGIRGRVLVVKDGKGDAAANPITVTPAVGTVDGAASYTVNTARGAVTLQCDGGGDWSVLARM